MKQKLPDESSPTRTAVGRLCVENGMANRVRIEAVAVYDCL